MNQQTINQEFTLSGIGLHTGQESTVTVKPAESGGIVFKRVDLEGQPEIAAIPENILKKDVSRCTAIGCGNAEVYTIEHLLAALAGLGIDHALIEINSEETPGLDGSAKEFVEAINKVGIKDLNKPRHYFIVTKPVSIAHNDAMITIFPADEFKISYTLNYDLPNLRSQFFEISVTPETFTKELASCRTFCLESEAKLLKENGYGKGATHQNTLIMHEDGPIDNELRFEDECARHKALDCLGDLFLLGRFIKGHVYATRSGHQVNRLLVKKLSEQIKDSQIKPVVVPEGTLFDVHQIMNTIPHRYPFLLVDRVIITEPGKKATGIKNITINEPFFKGHFPIKPVMPGVLMVEAMAQVCGVLALGLNEDDNRIALFMSIDKVKFRRMLEPGDQLVMEVEMLKNRKKYAQLKGVGKVGDDIVVEADMMFSYFDTETMGN